VINDYFNHAYFIMTPKTACRSPCNIKRPNVFLRNPRFSNPNEAPDSSLKSEIKILTKTDGLTNQINNIFVENWGEC